MSYEFRASERLGNINGFDVCRSLAHILLNERDTELTYPTIWKKPRHEKSNFVAKLSFPGGKKKHTKNILQRKIDAI